MREKIIKCATDLFLRLGFKSITMDDIAGEMCISKKTIYKYFSNKEILIAESTEAMQRTVRDIIDEIVEKNYNPIRESFEIRKMFKGIFQSAETSPLYQLKKHYAAIYKKVVNQELEDGFKYLQRNVERGIAGGWYRDDGNINEYCRLYYMLIFAINEHTPSEKEAHELEVIALQYHIRALATPKGIKELELQLTNQ